LNSRVLPDNILAQNGFIHYLNTTDAIAEEDYKQVELIGWLYQFYISEKKDEVFAGFKKNQKARAEDIPAATQIFTPNWIVKYMVQNTAGRIWLDHHPNSPLKAQMKYLVEAPTEEPSERIPPFGGTKGGQNTPNNQPDLQFNFEDSSKVSPLGGDGRGASLLKGGDPLYLKLLDPATGSGHILVEGFSLLYEMYMEEYYQPSVAVENILTKNLFGLELDLRAAQLACFAVLLAAAKKVPEILKKDILPRIYAMPEPAIFSRQEILDFLGSEGTQHEKVITNALQLMQQAQNLGSVMQFNITSAEREYFKTRWQALQTEVKSILEKQALLQKLEPFLDVLFALTRSYEAIAANPPYMGSGNMNNELKVYVNHNYPNSGSDLMTVFMDLSVKLTISNGKIGMINLPSWMFLSTFENLRKDLVKDTFITSLIQQGRGIFGSDFGSVSFCLENNKSLNRKGIYRRLFVEHVKVDSVATKEKRFLDQSFGYYITDQLNFSKIPGNPIAYWLSKSMIEVFENFKSAKNHLIIKEGLKTGNNEQFIRLWYEVNFSNFSINSLHAKWFPHTKGGDYRKWFGNQEFVLNYLDNGKELKSLKTASFTGIENYFKPYVTWSRITSSKISFRYTPEGSIPNMAGLSAVSRNYNDTLTSFCSFANTKLCNQILTILNPTINFPPGTISNIPFNEIESLTVKSISSSCINISKQDWNSHETSWDFHENPLLQGTRNNNSKLEDSFNYWDEEVSKQFYQLHTNEEELNRIFIDIYGLNKELDPVVPLKDITILQEELDRTALEKTDKELRKRRQWKLEAGEWNLYVDNQLQPPHNEGELPVATVQPPLPIKKEVVARQLISYAIGCMMGRYSLQKPGLILANQGETLDDYYKLVQDSSPLEKEPVPNSREGIEGGFKQTYLGFEPDDDAIIPLMGSNCGFADDALYRLRHFIEVVWGSESLTQNINFLQSCLDMDLEKYLTGQNNFWKDHTSRYKKKPIYWLFSSPTGAFQVITYMHRMNKFTVQKIRDNYLLKHLQWLSGQISQMESSGSLVRDEQKKLDGFRKALLECEAYNLQLKNIADLQIEFDLDDGVSVNYPKFEPVVASIK
jgi:hypothetical protein